MILPACPINDQPNQTNRKNCNMKTRIESDTPYTPEELTTHLCELPEQEFKLGGRFDRVARIAGFASGKACANDFNWWSLTLREALTELQHMDPAPAKAEHTPEEK